jgi:hypothetical protein
VLDVLEPWLRSADLVEQVRHIAQLAATRAGDLDQDGSFPTEDIHALAAIGAPSKAPMPPAYGGLGLGTTPEGALVLLVSSSLKRPRGCRGILRAGEFLSGYAPIPTAPDGAAIKAR